MIKQSTLNWVAFLTLLRKECNRWLRIWKQTLLPVVINQTLYFIIFGSMIGSRIGEVKGVSYMAFLVPGLVMMAIINGAFNNVVSSFFGSKFQKNIEELLVSPTPNWVIIAGYVAGGVGRGLTVGLLVFLVSFFFARPEIYSLSLILLFSILTAVLFSLGGLLNGIYAQKFDDVSIFNSFILTPLIYLGGVFYSIEGFSPFWQNFAKANPLLYMVDGFRYGFYGVSDISISISLSILLVLTVMATVLCLHLMRIGKGLRT